MKITFNKPYMTGKELGYIAEAHFNRHLAGDGGFTHKCHAWLEAATGCARALLTHSCTAALEMTALLMDIQPGDEIIMPSYTFVSTANAFVLRGGVPVFVDIRPDTLNIDESRIEAAITARTRAIVVVHYAGVSCEMDPILEISRKHGLAVVEDAAQGVMSKYKGRPLGSIGDFGTYSFHETKNVICGEGGALLVNNPDFVELAEIMREKGTDRSRFFRGEVDKYTWQNLGSSFLPGEVTAAFLLAQLEAAEEITAGRISIWNSYHEAFADGEAQKLFRRPVIPASCQHNAHMYYLLLPDPAKRAAVLKRLKEDGINAIFHYVPLHSSPAGLRFGRTHAGLENTDALSAGLMRLPLWYGMSDEELHYVVDRTLVAIGAANGKS